MKFPIKLILLIVISEIESQKFPDSCGISSLPETLTDKCFDNNFQQYSPIVGGKNVAFREHPWAVSIHSESPSGDYSHECGGTIISDRWILTAAHCIDTKGMRYIHYGSDHRINDGQLWPINNYFIHPQFDNLLGINDIALIKTSHSLGIRKSKTTYLVNAICLPNENDTIDENTLGIIIGWGKMINNNNENLAENLQKITHRLYDYDDSKCQLRNMLICSVAYSNTENACSGDSGGAIISYNSNGRAVIYGVVNRTVHTKNITDSCLSGKGYHSRVLSHVNWIKSHITKN